MPAFLNPIEAEFWVGVGLVIFLVIAFWKGGRAITGALDSKAVKIKGDLDEAARLRAEAEALLAQLKAERAEAERRAESMLAAAKADAEAMAADAAARLEEQITRRRQLAERRIANAEAQATAEVKAAAAALAVDMAQQVFAARLAAGEPDPLLDRGIAGLQGRLN